MNEDFHSRSGVADSRHLNVARVREETNESLTDIDGGEEEKDTEIYSLSSREGQVVLSTGFEEDEDVGEEEEEQKVEEVRASACKRRRVSRPFGGLVKPLQLLLESFFRVDSWVL